MNPNQPPQVYTTRHYNYNAPSRAQAPPYPYYANNNSDYTSYSNPPTTVTYVNDRYPPNPPTNYASYAPPSPQRYPANNSPMRPNPSAGGGVEKTNVMSDGSPFYDPGRRYEPPPMNSSRTAASFAAQPKSGGPTNKTLNLSDENPFHQVYGGYHYPSSIDPSKRITTQNTANRSTDNKSLNLSDESPFFQTYGRYHYPSQIDPTKRITEMPKQAGPVGTTNELSDLNPFSNYRPPPQQNPRSHPPDDDWTQNSPAPLSYRPVQVQRPPPEPYYGARAASPPRQPSPPAAPARFQPPRQDPSAPMDKTSLNMSPDNPFASTYGHYHYPSNDEIKAQKRMNVQNNRFADDERPRNDARPVGRAAPPPPSNQMSEYPEPEQKEVMTGKGSSKFTRFDVNF